MKELIEQIKITKEVVEGTLNSSKFFTSDAESLILRNQLVIMKMLEEIHNMNVLVR